MAYWPFVSLVWRKVSWSLLPFWKVGLFFSLLLSTHFWILDPYQIYDLKIFSPIVWVAFALSWQVCFWWTQVLNFDVVQVIFFSPLVSFVVMFKKTIYLSFISWRFTLTFSSKTFTVLALTFRYLIIWSILSWFLCLVREVEVQLLSLACGFSVVLGFPSGPSGKEPSCQCRRCKIREFDSWVRKIPWSRKWHPSILAWKIPWAEEPGGL